MKEVERIKEKAIEFKRDWEASRGCCDVEDFSDDVLYLISRLEYAERVLKKIAIPMPGSRDNELVLHYERTAQRAVELLNEENNPGE